jgi:hypothetical protein
VRARSALAGAGLAVGTVIIAGALVAEFAGGKEASPRPGAQVAPSTTTTTSPPTGWLPVVPATTVPPSTPVQQQYDRGFEAGFSSAGNEAMMNEAETLPVSPPSVGGGWPVLRSNDTPEGWALEFVGGLLDIDFSHRSRAALGGWLVAAEAPDLMPGIPDRFADRALYVSVLEPAITGQPSPVPSAEQWHAYANTGVRWLVSDLEVQLNPQWQDLIDAGWQPPDIRAAVLDVSGILTTSRGKTRSANSFSMIVQVGSARWHEGYGTVLVSAGKGP